MPTEPVLSIAERRRVAADQAVRRFLASLEEVLAGVPHTIVDGSAVAAFVQLQGESAGRVALRVDVGLSGEDAVQAAGAALARAGYERGDASGDVELMRIAHRRGRRPVHVLFEHADLTPAPSNSDRRPAQRLHPGSREAIEARARRLAGAFVPVVQTWSLDRVTDRSCDAEGGRTSASESRDVHLTLTASDRDSAPKE